MSLSKLSLSPRLPLMAVALTLSLGIAGNVHAGAKEDARASDAVRVLTDIQAIPESAIPDKLLDEAQAIVVVPDTIKVGLVLGGRRGHGLISVKSPEGTWSNPVFVSLTGGSIGFQAGVQSADVVLVFRNKRSLESVVNGKITLGADAGVAAGPVGRNASAATDGQLKAEIWSWSRARGLFAGVALDGAVLAIDDAANEAVYGQDTTPRMIFEDRAKQAPSSAVVDFRDRLEEATALARATRGTDKPATATTAASSTVPAAATPSATPAIDPAAADSQPQPFQPVEDNPTTTEPLPASN